MNGIARLSVGVRLLVVVATFRSHALLAADVMAKAPVIRVVPNCRECVSVGEINFSSSIIYLDGKPLMVKSSALILMDEKGEVLGSIANPYDDDGTTNKGRGTSGRSFRELPGVLAKSNGASYTVVLRVNEWVSNVARFKVVGDLQENAADESRGDCPGSVEIEPVEDLQGTMSTHELLSYFRNRSSDSVRLPALWAGSRLLVDGKEYRLSMFGWGGAENFPAGRSWGNIVDLDIFVDQDRQRIRPGEHSIQYQFGECLSNELRLKVELGPPWRLRSDNSGE